jgi:phosphoserine phosphatase
MKKEIFPGAFSERYTVDEISNMLLNNEKKRMGLILDLDGTIHRGLLPKGFFESSNADLAFYLFPQIMLHDKKRILPYISTGISMTSKAIRYYLPCGKEQGTLSEKSSEIERILFQQFSENILKGMNYELVVRASEKIPNNAYPFSLECISKIGKNSERTAIISKAFQPILDAYQIKLREFGIEIEGYGNRLLVDELSRKIVGLDNSDKILSAYDKSDAARKILGGLESSAIFGNSEDDIAMFEEADSMFGKYSLKIAMNIISKKIIEKADVYFWGWKPVKEILQMNQKSKAGKNYKALINL